MISLEEMSPILTINSVNVESDIAIAQFRIELYCKISEFIII